MMTSTIDDSLTLGLRALATLAEHGPLDVPRLALLHDSDGTGITAVVAELERGGLVQRLADRRLIAITARGAALAGRPAPWLH